MLCSRNFCDYDSYYRDQVGGKLDISYYRGAPYQRGYGIFSSFAKRFGIPAIKYLFKQGVHFGKDLLSDVVAGKNPKESAKSNLRKRTASAFKDLGERIHSNEKSDQIGSGLRKKPRLNIKKRKSNKKRSKKVKAKRKTRKSSNKKVIKRYDIFK